MGEMGYREGLDSSRGQGEVFAGPLGSIPIWLPSEQCWNGQCLLLRKRKSAQVLVLDKLFLNSTFLSNTS